MRNTPSLRMTLSILALGVLGAVLVAPPVGAGGQFEDFVLSFEPGPLPATLPLERILARWDERCLPTHFVLNTIALPNADPPLDAAATAAVLEQAMATWSDVPTSYAELRLSGQIQRPPVPGGVIAVDFVSEINFLSGAASFAGGTALRMLPLDEDIAPGRDYDGDGDSDFFDPVAAGLERCADIDGDGDIELPAGFYRAGTILESDITFNNDWIWTTGLPDASPATADLEAAAAHELGHALGLAHTLVNQISAGDGTGATMFNPFDLDDPADQLAARSLATDDVAWISLLYPEGSAGTGPAALGLGDVAFDEVFGVIRGELTHGRTGWPLVGGSIYAVERDSGRVATSHHTGRARGLFDLVQGQAIPFVSSLPEYHLVDGAFTLPVPAGEYHLAVEAMDGAPISGEGFMRRSSALAGSFFGILDFNEEFLLKKESEHELLEVEVEAGEVVEIDHTTRVDVNLDPFDLVGLFEADADMLIDVPPGLFLAVRIPAPEMAAFLGTGLPRAMAFRVGVEDRSVAPVFARAALAPGHAEEGFATLDLEESLAGRTDFPGQDNDFAPFFFDEPEDLAEDLWEAMTEGGISDFFLVLRLPQTAEGVSGLPPLVGVDLGQEAGLLGRSYASFDGAVFFQVADFNLMFRMVFRP